MSEVDPVILRLVADNVQYLSTLRSTTTRVDQLLGTQEKRVKQLEYQMKASSGAIAGSLRGLGGALAGYFTGRELVGLLDGFTRLQNNLKVAGLEGENLKAVQDRLFSSAQKYGVELEGLSKLYSTLSQASKELGATQSDVFGLTDSVSAALKISGISAQEASGALLQLGQALRGGKVQAEEYNSLIDGLYPLLEAAAGGSARWSGSVAKLTKDVKDGKVSSQEFFRAILAGSDILENKASKATLTLSAGFTTLSNAMVKYFGEADKANGVSAALGETLGALANNLDTVIPALATVASIIGVRYAVGAAEAAAKTVLASNAMFALQARAAGAATSMEALSFAMGGLKGGFVTVVLVALGAALTYVYDQTMRSREATGQYAKAQAESADISKKTADVIEQLASAHGKARVEALKLAKAQAEVAKQNLEVARTAVLVAQAELFQARGKNDDLQRGNQLIALGGPSAQAAIPGNNIIGQGGVRQAEGNLAASIKTMDAREADLAAITAKLAGYQSPGVNAGTGGGPAAGTRKGGGGADRTKETAARVQDELDRLNVDLLRSVAEMTNSAQDRATAEEAGLKADRASFDRQLGLDKDMNDAQRKDMTAARDAADAQARRAISVRKSEDLAREQFDRDSAANALESEVVDASGRVNDRTAREKRTTELRKIDLEFSQREADAMLAYDDATARGDAVAADIARSKLARIVTLKQLAQQEAALRNQSPLEALRDQLNQSTAQINEALEDVQAKGLRSLEDGLVDAITHAKDLGDVFKGVANSIIADLVRIAVQRSIIGPLTNLLSGGSLLGGIGGGANAAAINTLSGPWSQFAPGRAVGGPVSAGGTYLVGERGPELLRMGGQSGLVVPNNRLTSGGSSVSQNITINVDAQGALLAGQVQAMVQQGMQQATAMGSQIGAGQAEGRMMSRARRRIPG